MITKDKIGNELYVWIWERGLKKLLYKRWIDNHLQLKIQKDLINQLKNKL